jgi:uncharacterized protein (TIGR02117 family)
MFLRKFLKRILKIIGWFLLFIILYFISAFTFSWISVNSDFKQCDKDAVEIYILTNGVHTDLVLPIKNELKDWTAFVNPSDTKSADTSVSYAAFGWGDKGFYLETPTWADLKFSTAFKAMFFLSSSAMHVTFHKSLFKSETCRKICITKENYRKLVNYIDNSFDKDNGSARLIKGASYSDHDLFYEATGTYNLFYTCNTWANSGLKAADLKACLWTPFDQGIFYQYKFANVPGPIQYERNNK